MPIKDLNSIIGSVAIVDPGNIPGIPRRPLQFVRKAGETDADFNLRIAARLTELMEVSVTPVEMYGKQPDPLPEELPAGTRLVDDIVFKGARSSSDLVLRNGDQYWGRWEDEPGDDHDTFVRAAVIDWANTPVVGQSRAPAPTTFEEQAALARQAFAEAEATAGVAPLIGPLQGNVVERSAGKAEFTIDIKLSQPFLTPEEIRRAYEEAFNVALKK